MAIELNPKPALISAVKAADKPIAFLVGAPLSQDSGGGVPGVDAMRELIRAEILTRVPSELSRYDQAVSDGAGAAAYQKAMGWLQSNLTQDAVNRVVAKAVRAARKPGAPADFTRDGVPGDWYLPPGTRQLAGLVVSNPERFPGPILTTNFDPLLALSIRSAGGQARLRVIDSDGNVGRVVEHQPGETDIVHLHGYWRDSDTLHTPSQLTSPRPKLKASLQKLLGQRTLIVAAYGGWDDVFTAALAELLNDDEARLNVLWCFYEDNPAIVGARYEKLLNRVAPAIIRGRFLAYGGIDCHSIFAETGGITISVAASPPGSGSTLADWDQIDSAYLSALTPLRREEVIRYFDGALPTWRHAVTDAIPRRQAVTEISGRLSRLNSTRDDCSLQLIRAAGGEGKTTILLQAAADAARNGDWQVLWRPSHQIGLSPEQVGKLDAATQWLIVADDAENLIRDLSDSARLLHNAGRHHVHFLLAARDTDWRFAQGDNEPWEQWLNRQPDIILRKIVHDDAVALVTAWREYGAEGLRALTRFPDPARQAAELEKAVRDAAHSRIDGSLFGGLLAVRFGQNGLQAHVRSFLRRLKDISVEGGSGSLFDALIYIAACHGAGIQGINETVLADLVGAPRNWVQSRIVQALGEEAAAARSGEHVFTRHSKVAAAVLVEAGKNFGVALSEVWAAIVRQTIQTGREIRMDRQWFSQIIHAGPRLQRALPPELEDRPKVKERRNAVAIAAAKAAVKYKPEWLGCIDSLARTWRQAGDVESAIRLFRDNLSEARSKADYHKVIRAYWYEWSICEGERGQKREHALAKAWLCGLSLSDHLNPAPLTPEDVKLICTGLGVSFGKLAQPGPACPYARGRRAATYLGRLKINDPTARGYFELADEYANKLQTPRPGSVTEAIAWLTAAVAEAGREVQDSFLLGLTSPEQISFTLFRSFLSSR